MTKKKQPDDHLEIVRHKILDTARALFVQQGYKKTTIRQIVEHSGVLTGSIYHFFQNKEDLFQALVLAMLNECVAIIDERFPGEDPVFKYAVMCLTELKAVEGNAWVRECYYEGYSSKVIFEKMVEHQTLVAERLFAGREPSYTTKDHYRRSLLIKGALRSCVAEFYFSRPGDFSASWHMLMQMILPLYGTGAKQTAAIVGRLEAMESVVDEISRCLIERSRVL